MKNRDSARTFDLVKYRRGQPLATQADEAAVEEPLEIRVEGRSVAVVMRTPGHDRELATGFVLSEGIVRSGADIFEITSCLTTGDSAGNGVDLTLVDPAKFDLTRLSRHVFSSSSCGICGKATIESAIQQFAPINAPLTIDARVLLQLPEKLFAAQKTFQRTGGLHACALFDAHGELILLREDVGRHNALDKLIGHQLLAGQLPLGNCILLLSGRVSFEMTQKALAAGIGVLAAISAPTSLAIEFARANNQTLIGFLRGDTMNVYAGTERITPG
ncbi:formate dehydrogenase accessory sulfurtransferase FdhD [soil metagenome]